MSSEKKEWIAYSVWVSGEGDTSAMDAEYNDGVVKAMKEHLKSGRNTFPVGKEEGGDGFTLYPKKYSFTTKNDRDTAVKMADASWEESIAEHGHYGSTTFFMTQEEIDNVVDSESDSDIDSD